MNASELNDQGRIVAIAATVNLLLKQLDHRDIESLKHELVAELQRIADNDRQIVDSALNYAEKAFTGLG